MQTAPTRQLLKLAGHGVDRLVQRCPKLLNSLGHDRPQQQRRDAQRLAALVQDRPQLISPRLVLGELVRLGEVDERIDLADEADRGAD